MSNILLNKPATASDYYAPFTPAKAVDGISSPLSRWVSSKVPAWLEVNPGALYMVNRWVVKHPSIIATINNAWNNSNYANVDYKLQGSNDNNSWYDIDGVTNNSSVYTDRQFAPIAYQYFRVYVTKGLRCNTQTTSIAEFELYQAYSSQLTNLTISAGTLTPAFTPTILTYTDTVGPDVASVIITPTALDPQAIIKINNLVSPSGQPKSVTLNYGVNNIVVNVTAGDGSQNNYTIAVTRAGNADLKSLVAQDNRAAIVPLNPAFDKGIINYNAKIDYDASAIAYIPTTDDPLATIKLDGTSTPNGSISGASVVGTGITNVFEVTSTSENKKSYSVAVSKNTSAYLTNLQALISGVAQPLTPVFGRNTLAYTLSIANTVNGVVVAVTPEDANATVVVTSNGTVVTKGSSGYAVKTSTSGTYNVVVQVTSTSNDVKNYTLTITKN